MQPPFPHDITWFVEAICAATAVSGAAQTGYPQPIPVRPRCRIVEAREAIALPPPSKRAA